MELTTSHLENLNAFHTILPLYQEAVASGGGMHPMSTDGPTDPSASFNSSVIVPTVSDFTADVEKATRRVLSIHEQRYFYDTYKSGMVLVDADNTGVDDEDLIRYLDSFETVKRCRVAELDYRIRSLVGGSLIKAGIFPIAQYLTAVDTRGKRT